LLTHLYEIIDEDLGIVMKFGKNLARVVELSDPEWAPYWINYHLLKRKIKREIANESWIAGAPANLSGKSNYEVVGSLLKSSAEVDFFRALRVELSKTSKFFATSERLFIIRFKRIKQALDMLQQSAGPTTPDDWSRLLTACVRFYREVLMLENFAIMNYCGFSKILKKHDKVTGLCTRDAFMTNVMSLQNFTNCRSLLDLISSTEELFNSIKKLEK
jgi:SPX domain protein involved in polyphosphate accumulation